MSYYIKRGNTWIPELVITQGDEAFDCTGYTAKLWIKETLKEISPEIQELDINWTDQANGLGYFTLTHAMSSNMLGKYWIEVILYYETTFEVVRTLIQDRLIIRETLEVNL